MILCEEVVILCEEVVILCEEVVILCEEVVRLIAFVEVQERVEVELSERLAVSSKL